MPRTYANLVHCPNMNQIYVGTLCQTTTNVSYPLNSTMMFTNKEIVVIVNCFQEWRHFLISASKNIVVFTDQKNLEYFHTTKLLNRRQARWAEILSQFNFKIIYRPGEKNGRADALSRRVEPELKREGEKQDLMIHMFKPGQFQLGENEEALLTRHVY